MAKLGDETSGFLLLHQRAAHAPDMPWDPRVHEMSGDAGELESKAKSVAHHAYAYDQLAEASSQFGSRSLGGCRSNSCCRLVNCYAPGNQHRLVNCNASGGV